MEGGQDFSVFSYDLGGQLAFRVFKLFKRRDVRKCPHKPYEAAHKDERSTEHDPEPLDDFLFCFFFHYFHFTVGHIVSPLARTSLQRKK